jgi:hypothetical protein
MKKTILLVPSPEAVDRSVDARYYVDRLRKRLEVEYCTYQSATEGFEVPDDADSVGLMVGLISLELDSGYMETELEHIFRPQELLAQLRSGVADDYPLVAIVDDAYSDYMLSALLKAGASAVVGTSGELFGIVLSRLTSWEQVYPYMNVFPSIR